MLLSNSYGVTTSLNGLENINCNYLNYIDASFYDPSSSIQNQFDALSSESVGLKNQRGWSVTNYLHKK